MEIAERLQTAVQGSPDEITISLPLATLKEWLGENNSLTAASVGPDLTVK
jgi:hypothetical protein